MQKIDKIDERPKEKEEKTQGKARQYKTIEELEKDLTWMNDNFPFTVTVFRENQTPEKYDRIKWSSLKNLPNIYLHSQDKYIHPLEYLAFAAMHKLDNYPYFHLQCSVARGIFSKQQQAESK